MIRVVGTFPYFVGWSLTPDQVAHLFVVPSDQKHHHKSELLDWDPPYIPSHVSIMKQE